MMSDVYHRIQTRGSNVTAVRERIERKLNIETTAKPEGEWWAIYFHAPVDVNLDFLRPDVLPFLRPDVLPPKFNE